MACDFPPLQCLEWHVKPHLREPKPGGTGSYRALCPAHDDHEHSLGVSVGDKLPIVFNCFACKNRAKVRHALNRDGIDLGCLPLTTAEKEELLDRLYRIATADTADHGAVRFGIVAALEGHKDRPSGAEVDRIAELAHVHRATGYRARRAAGASTANPGSYTRESDHVKPPSTEAGSGPPDRVA